MSKTALKTVGVSKSSKFAFEMMKIDYCTCSYRDFCPSAIFWPRQNLCEVTQHLDLHCLSNTVE